eukprot:TRINITY_DN455_c0_g1_i5.p1 TRINITY_DN455_c0_g1~~TRINITY_DN455_c0_g1_i5.p1  ORF type:complete len:207 (-),score=33.43 TRINITY_DN455_c0_g1_i5:41-661(-)
MAVLLRSLGLLGFVRFFIYSTYLSLWRSSADAANVAAATGVSVADAKVLMNLPYMAIALKTVLKTNTAVVRVMKAVMESMNTPAIDQGPARPSFFRERLPPGTTPQHALHVYKHYLGSCNVADESRHIRKNVDVEDTPTSWGFHVTQCMYAETYKLLGVAECAPVICYSDDLFLPGSLGAVGVGFKRTGTIGAGAKFCDFNFYVLK